LGHIKSLESAKVLLKAIKDRKASGYKIASMLEDFPPLIVEELIKILDGPDELLRLWALRLLSRFKPRQYLDKFLRLTADNSAEIRANACECLGEIAEGQAKDAVAGCLKDDAWFVRLKAVLALEKITGAKSIARIVFLIIDENWFVREAVKEIMAAHIDESISFIEEIFLSGNQQAGQSCLEVLERSGYDKKILEEIFSPSRDIKDKAMRLLAGMIKAGGHLGLEAYLITCGEERRNKITGIIASIDKQRAEHIDKIIKGMIVEF
jgi:HEAT repeat protein